MSQQVHFSLPSKRRKAVELLALGYSLRQAAAEVGVCEKTIRRWLKRPDVAQALQEIQEEVWGATVRKLRALGEKAVTTLGEVMGDQTAPPTARVRAARATLELIVKVGEIEELRERLERLEALAERFKGGLRSEGTYPAFGGEVCEA